MQLEKTFKQYVKDTVKLFEASGPDALEFSSHLYNYESRIAEITPPQTHLDDPAASNQKITIGMLGMMSTSVSSVNLLHFEPVMGRK